MKMSSCLSVSSSRQPEVSELRRHLREFLAEADRRGAQIAFWWRDDDAREHTAQLERLLRIAEERRLPLALAVIPCGATEALARRLGDAKNAAILQHGWQHKNHSAPEDRASEFGDNRRLNDMLGELSAGRKILAELFGDQSLPVLVPPWNRIGDSMRRNRKRAGLPGLSVFGPRNGAFGRCVNAHLDIIHWRAGTARDPAEAYATLCAEVERRLQGDSEPVGILTHHLAHDDAAWSLLEMLLDDLSGCAGSWWPLLNSLFELPLSRSGRRLPLAAEAQPVTDRQH
jgi:peptidoglycan/xylan/chitin deacetylase (PgdA/CDA1 family)